VLFDVDPVRLCVEVGSPENRPNSVGVTVGLKEAVANIGVAVCDADCESEYELCRAVTVLLSVPVRYSVAVVVAEDRVTLTVAETSAVLVALLRERDAERKMVGV
jgi:hypothetical protein